MIFSSAVNKVVDVTGDGNPISTAYYKMEIKGKPKPMARPRRGRQGFFYNPSAKDVAALKTEIKVGIDCPPIFASNQPVVVEIDFFTDQSRRVSLREQTKGVVTAVWLLQNPPHSEFPDVH